MRNSYFVSGAIHLDFFGRASPDTRRDIRARPFVLRWNKSERLKSVRQSIRNTKTGVFKAHLQCNGDCAPTSEAYQIETKVEGESVEAEKARKNRNRQGQRNQCPVRILVRFLFGLMNENLLEHRDRRTGDCSSDQRRRTRASDDLDEGRTHR